MANDRCTVQYTLSFDYKPFISSILLGIELHIHLVFGKKLLSDITAAFSVWWHYRWLFFYCSFIPKAEENPQWLSKLYCFLIPLSTSCCVHLESLCLCMHFMWRPENTKTAHTKQLVILVRIWAVHECSPPGKLLIPIFNKTNIKTKQNNWWNVYCLVYCGIDMTLVCTCSLNQYTHM